MNKILILDDDREFLEGVRSILEDAGFKYIATADTKTIQQKIRSYHPNLVLLDVFLDDANGKDIAQKLRQAKDTHSIPIVLVSGSTKVKEYWHEVKADAYLNKPFSGSELVDTINKHIQN